jgi:putative transposase
LAPNSLNTSWFWNLFDARRKIAAWQKSYNFTRPHSALGYKTPDEFARQWEVASFSAREDRIVDQLGQGDPGGLRFAPALTQLLPDPNVHFQENEAEKCGL